MSIQYLLTALPSTLNKVHVFSVSNPFFDKIICNSLLTLQLARADDNSQFLSALELMEIRHASYFCDPSVRTDIPSDFPHVDSECTGSTRPY